MDRDILILIAFCLFVFLVGIRFKQRLSGRRPKLSGPEDTSEEKTDIWQSGSRRRYFFMVQFIVLGGLLIYMALVLIRGFVGSEALEFKEYFLRCLIFVFTIYIFVRGCRKVFKRIS